MKQYCVSKTSNNPGRDHEVHEEGCYYYPSFSNRIELGYQVSKQHALNAAKAYYSDADGCIHCCPEIHRR